MSELHEKAPTRETRTYAPLWIALASLLWASDSIVRYPTASGIDFRISLFAAHLIGILLIAPIVLLNLFRLSLFRATSPLRFIFSDFLLVLVVGIGGSALGGIFFARSVLLIGPSFASVLLMLEPLIVLAAAYVFLKERRSGLFFPVAFWAVLNGILISAPDFGASGNLEGFLLAAAATFLWGASTVAGKSLVSRHAPILVVFWRWLSASVFFLVSASFSSHEGIARELATGWAAFRSTPNALALLYLASFAGVLPMWLYYRALRQMPASLAAFIELLGPLAGALLPVLVSGGKLSLQQAIASILLVLSIWLLVSVESAGPQSKDSRIFDASASPRF